VQLGFVGMYRTHSEEEEEEEEEEVWGLSDACVA